MIGSAGWGRTQADCQALKIHRQSRAQYGLGDTHMRHTIARLPPHMRRKGVLGTGDINVLFWVQTISRCATTDAATNPTGIKTGSTQGSTRSRSRTRRMISAASVVDGANPIVRAVGE